MNLFDVYNLWDIELVKGLGTKVWDKNGVEFLDFYGGHAVISIGHSHPKYVQTIQKQVAEIGFYSNSVQNSLQENLAQKLTALSGYTDYNLFLCNSGAEANENALKLASFYTKKKRVLAFRQAFHGRTSGAVAVTDNLSIQSAFNQNHDVTFLSLNDSCSVEEELKKGDVSAVIIEGIQGVAGIYIPEKSFLQKLQSLCNQYDVPLVLDEIQSGYGRTGKFFAHQYAEIKPDIITMAKGMGNGFPVGGLLISPKFKAQKGMLGTTFGGNHLACVAGISVLDVLEEENLIANAEKMGKYLKEKLSEIEQIKEVRGVGLMIGMELPLQLQDVRNKLLFEKHIFTGGSKNNVIRLLPALSITKKEIDIFINNLKSLL